MRRFPVLASGALLLALAAGAAFAQAPATSFNLPPGIAFPMCDGTRTDQCLQLGQNTDLDKRVDQLFPKCAKMGDPKRKGACVNAAMEKR
ncbi:MAG TPA: hypothetical protein VMU85_04365 [Stellaceae bacterium]|nr:hypothetical protein [Stellaceae bacterium]